MRAGSPESHLALVARSVDVEMKYIDSTGNQWYNQTWSFSLSEYYYFPFIREQLL